MFTAGYVLCVDFGTSNTVAYLRWPDGRSKALLFDGTPLKPSAVFAPPSGALMVGRDALHHGRHRPGLLEPNPKRRIDDGAVLLGERDIPVPELVGAVLAHIGQEATRVGGSRPDALVLSHPAGWGPVRRLTLTDAAAIADLPAPQFVVEPVAAARYFAGALGGAIAPEQVLVVYDLGAGTFDVSVIRDGEVLGSDGVDDVGGIDFDAAIVGWLRDRYDAEQWTRLTTPGTDGDLRLRLDLWSEARVAKEMLSRGALALMRPPLLADEVLFTLEDFERLARPLVERTVRTAVSLTRYCAVSADHILLVGGSSRIPLVATALHRAFGLAPTVTEQPETVVAEGCLATLGPISAAVATRAAGRVSVAPVSPPTPAPPPAPVSPAAPVSALAAVSAPPAPAALPVRRPVPKPRPSDEETARLTYVQLIPQTTATAPRPETPRPETPAPPPAEPSPRRRRRAALVLVTVLALVAALAATALLTDVYSRRKSGDATATPPTDPGVNNPSASASPPVGLPDWPVKYSDSLQIARNWSTGALPEIGATCDFKNKRLEITMDRPGIYRCPGQRDDLTDFAVTVDLYLASGTPGIPCAGIWFRLQPREAGRDSGYVVKVCTTQIVLSYHRTDGKIVDFARFPTDPIAAGQKTNVGLAVKGDEITVYRAGRPVGSQRDSAYPRGRIALGVAVEAPTGANDLPVSGTVGYNNIEVRWP